jgi:hypothetical protein
MKIKKLIATLGLVGLLLGPQESKASSSLYSGYTGPNYALQYKTNEKLDDNLTGKFFSQSLPIWAYFGAPLAKNGPRERFYGFGAVLSLKNIHLLPTLEGYKTDFSESLYSTLDLPQGLELDVVPHFNQYFKYSSADINLYREVFGLAVGVSTSFDDNLQLDDLSKVSIQIGKYFKSWNITSAINPRNKSLNLTLQKNF